MRPVENEIIDLSKKGNLVRLYLGKNGEQKGDNWDSIPYEHNARTVYGKFIKGYCDIVIDFDYEIKEPHEHLNVVNLKYCKQDMVKKKVYALVIVSSKKKTRYIYFGDKIEGILKLEPCHLVQFDFKKTVG